MLDKLYLQIEGAEFKIKELTVWIQSIVQEKPNSDAVYNYLLLFSQYYEEFTGFEKKEFMNPIAEKVETVALLTP